METAKWKLVKDKKDKMKMSFVLGNRDIALPPDAIISVTRLENMTIWRTILNNVLNLFVMGQLKRKFNKKKLLYAELTGSGKERGGNTLTIWSGVEMGEFKRSGSHKYAMKFFRWIFGGQVESYFISWRANGRIPSYEEATIISKQHGRHYSGNKLVSNKTRPEW
jgi:hypothetical protein